MEKAKIIGLILAGGRSRRMGGREKALLPFGRETLLTRAIARLRPQCETLLLNANGDPSRFRMSGMPVLSDSVDGHAGPLAGVLAGLDWMARHTPEAAALLTVPIDGPFFPKNLAERLQSAADFENAAIACASSNSHRHGVYGLWSLTVRDELRHDVVTKGIRKVGDWLGERRVAFADWPTEPIDPFFNINTPEDLAESERLLARFPDA